MRVRCAILIVLGTLLLKIRRSASDEGVPDVPEHFINMGELGWVNTTREWFKTYYREVNLQPRWPKDIDTTHKLYTRQLSERGVSLQHDTVSRAVRKAKLDCSLPFKILIHGWQASGKAVWVKDVRARVLDREEEGTGVLVVNYHTTFNFGQAAQDGRVVALEIERVLRSLFQVCGLAPHLVHIIGHSLGAHIAGYVGAAIPNISRITGLDPAEPMFQKMPPVVRLDPTDADFVDVIHTNVGAHSLLKGLGLTHPTGHIDFYLNEGTTQPGCSLLEVVMEEGIRPSTPINYITCSHSRATELFAESIDSDCPFIGFKCASATSFLKGECLPCGENFENCFVMGYDADLYRPKEQVESFNVYLTTADKTPFCEYTYEVTVELGNMSYPIPNGVLRLSLKSDEAEVIDMVIKEDRDNLTEELEARADLEKDVPESESHRHMNSLHPAESLVSQTRGNTSSESQGDSSSPKSHTARDSHGSSGTTEESREAHVTENTSRSAQESSGTTEESIESHDTTWSTRETSDATDLPNKSSSSESSTASPAARQSEESLLKNSSKESVVLESRFLQSRSVMSAMNEELTASSAWRPNPKLVANTAVTLLGKDKSVIEGLLTDGELWWHKRRKWSALPCVWSCGPSLRVIAIRVTSYGKYPTRPVSTRLCPSNGAPSVNIASSKSATFSANACGTERTTAGAVRDSMLHSELGLSRHSSYLFRKLQEQTDLEPYVPQFYNSKPKEHEQPITHSHQDPYIRKALPGQFYLNLSPKLKYVPPHNDFSWSNKTFHPSSISVSIHIPPIPLEMPYIRQTISHTPQQVPYSSQQISHIPQLISHIPQLISHFPHQISYIPQQILHNPQEIFDNPQHMYDNPQQIYDNPQQIYDNPQQIYDNQQQIYYNLQQIFDNTQQMFDNTQQIFDNTLRIPRIPQQVSLTPLKLGSLQKVPRSKYKNPDDFGSFYGQYMSDQPLKILSDWENQYYGNTR